MDLLPLGFLVLIVLMSGGIAVLADDLGRRIGKRRLHVKGLRPKHVAQLGTFIAGLIVSITTITVVAMVSADVRQWIRQGNRANVQLRNVNRQLSDAKKNSSALTDKVSHLSSEQQKLDRAISKLRTDSKTTQDELKRRTAQLSSLTQKVQTIQIRFNTAKSRILVLNGQVSARQSAYARAKFRLDKASAQLKTIQERLAKSEELEQTARGNTRVAIVQKQLTDEQNQQLLNQQRELKSQILDLRAATDLARNQLASGKSSLESTNQLLTQTNNDLIVAGRQLAEAQRQAASYYQIARIPRYAPMIFRAGAEVARLSVDPGLSFGRAEAALTSLIREARLVAKERGAQPNGPYPEAGIFQHSDKVTERPITAEELTREVVSKVAGSPEPIVMIATSSLNAFQGEPVSLEVTVLPNPLVYKANYIVSDVRIDGKKDPLTILNQINVLGMKLRARAQQDHMIPRVGAEELFGQLVPADVLQLVDLVKSSDRLVVLRAITERDTRAADPLHLRFAIR